MKIKLHKNFAKNYVKLTDTQKQKFRQRRDTFLKNPFDPSLGNHALMGKYQGYRSINITGDIRVIYRLLERNTAYFIDINTHSNLYR